METLTFLEQESKPWPGRRRRERKGNLESQAQKSWLVVKDSAHDMPMSPLRTQQALLAFDDNILEEHAAKEANIGGKEDQPPPGPLRLAQHCPLTLCFSMRWKSLLVNFLPSAQLLPCCLVLPCPTIALCPGGPAHWGIRGSCILVVAQPLLVLFGPQDS